MDIAYRPLVDRVDPGGKRKESGFRVDFAAVRSLLDRELLMLGAKNVVVEIPIAESDFRKSDGMPKANARPTSGGCRVSFDSKHGPLSYATATFTRGALTYVFNGQKARRMEFDWQHNLYAIARGLESLRKVDDYGVSGSGEQYTGWLQIEAHAGGMSRAAAIEVIALTAGLTNAAAEADLKRAHRMARRVAHPDANGGEDGRWLQIEASAKALGLL